MGRALRISVLSIAALAFVGSIRASEDCKDGCPIVGAARDAGASKDGVAKITQLRNEWMVSFAKIQQSSEYQQASKDLAAAKKHNDSSEIKAAETKVKSLVKPAWDAFHKGAEEALGKEMYATFCK